jgi:hypothetical protein
MATNALALCQCGHEDEDHYEISKLSSSTHKCLGIDVLSEDSYVKPDGYEYTRPQKKVDCACSKLRIIVGARLF